MCLKAVVLRAVWLLAVSVFSTSLRSTVMPETSLRKFCPHCNEAVSATTYRRHRGLYFDETSNLWTSSVEVGINATGHESSDAESNMDEGTIPHNKAYTVIVHYQDVSISDMNQDVDNDHHSEVSDGENEENGMLCHVQFIIIIFRTVSADSDSHLEDTAAADDDRMCAEEMTVNDGDLWDVDDEELMDDFQCVEEDQPSIPPGSPGSPVHSKLHNLLVLFVALLAKWSVFYNITENSLNSLLKVLGFFFNCLESCFPLLLLFGNCFLGPLTS